MFQGAFTAMVSPFQAGRPDRLDEGRLKENVAQQIEAGIDGLVPVGTTGESPTLSHEEHNRVVELVVEAAGGRVSRLVQRDRPVGHLRPLPPLPGVIVV